MGLFSSFLRAPDVDFVDDDDDDGEGKNKKYSQARKAKRRRSFLSRVTRGTRATPVRRFLYFPLLFEEERVADHFRTSPPNTAYRTQT